MRALRALANVFRLLFAPLWLLGRRVSRPKATWVVLRLESRVSEFRPRLTLLRRLVSRAPELRSSSLEDLRALVKTLVEDPRMRGVLVYVPALEAAWATCESLRDQLTKLRESGKQLVCYLTEGGGNRELFVASCADRIYVAPYTAFGPLGLASRPLYIRRLLDKIGIEVEAQACGEYKSAAEPALRDVISEPAREQTEALIWAMHRALEAGLRERRGLSNERIAEIFSRGLLRASEAKASGVIDDIVYEDELLDRLGFQTPESDKKKPSHFITPADYLRWRNARLWKPLREKPYIAVISLRGM
ncbi:MAG TPA: S49 family peptidase, partial [Polyangiales bacterium]|nr:S49 family peptidase [Polyangiales bacterium]